MLDGSSWVKKSAVISSRGSTQKAVLAAPPHANSPGEIAWGGAASTAFWVDPLEDVTALLFTQLLPSTTHPLRSRLRSLVYQALVD